MSKFILQKSSERGKANYGWLDTNYSFSFANYYNPNQMGFGALRVLNDDIVIGGMGFGTHAHDNMEIVTIPLEGELKHRDSMNSSTVIKFGEIQVMSAGSGITHSEINNKKDELLKLLQIWVVPNKINVTPRYDELSYSEENLKNNFYQIVSPNQKDAGSWIHQNAWFYLGKFDKDSVITYNLKDKSNGIYLFVIDGEAELENQILNKRDAIGVWECEEIKIKNLSDKSFLLLIEVPMEF